MAINMNKLAVSGAIAGVITPFLLANVVMPVLNFLGGVIPAFSLKLSTVSVNVRESLTGINGGLAGWLLDAMGISVPSNTMMVYVMGAVGGAVFFIVGGYLADMLGVLKKGNAVDKTRWTIFVGSAVAAIVLGKLVMPPTIGVDLLNVLIAFMINAAILAWVYGAIDSKAKLGLVPY